MSPSEVAWRVRGVARDVAERLTYRRQHGEQREASFLDEPGARWRPAFRVTDVPVGAFASELAGSPEHGWCEGLRSRGDAIAAGKLRLFDLDACDLGFPIQWNQDPSSGRSTPRTFAPSIDYRDAERFGDCKYVWEPGRHLHLVTLGRAYRATGERRYADALIAQLESFLHQCPYGVGMHWRSPLELGVRLLSWVYAIDAILESGALTRSLERRLLHAVYLHLRAIRSRFSRGSSANNHLVGEAAGAYVASAYFRGVRGAERVRRESWAILAREVLAQVHPDGANREQAFGYHMFSLQLFLVAAIVAERAGEPFPEPYGVMLERMCRFAAALLEGGGSPPMLGDADDGHVLDLGAGPDDARDLLAVAAVRFRSPELKAASRGFSEAACWLLGPGARSAYAGITGTFDRALRSRAFPDAGIYLLQHGERGSPDRLSASFDCGELGFGPIAAHGHADALAFTLRAFGRDVIVDPGTYDYFSFPMWRRYFRSTRAHSTIEVDGQDQSEMLGPFLWGERARARSTRWEPGDCGGVAAGEHDGYARLRDPVVHARELALDGPARALTVRDELHAHGRHDVALYLHVAEGCAVERVAGHRLLLRLPEGHVTIELDPLVEVEVIPAREDAPVGWVSRGYHRRARGTTIVGRAAIDASATLCTRIVVSEAHAPARSAVAAAHGLEAPHGRPAGSPSPWRTGT